MKETKFFKPNVPKKLSSLTWPQTKSRFPLMNSHGDADKDGLKNFRDCKPFDWKRQGEEHDEDKEPSFEDENTEEYFLG